MDSEVVARRARVPKSAVVREKIPKCAGHLVNERPTRQRPLHPDEVSVVRDVDVLIHLVGRLPRVTGVTDVEPDHLGRGDALLFRTPESFRFRELRVGVAAFGLDFK